MALGRGGGQKTRTCTTGRSARFAADGWAPRRSCPGRAVLGFTARELGHGAIRPRWTDGSCCCDMPEASVSCGRAACSSSAPPNGSQHHRGEVLSGLGVTGSPLVVSMTKLNVRFRSSRAQKRTGCSRPTAVIATPTCVVGSDPVIEDGARTSLSVSRAGVAPTAGVVKAPRCTGHRQAHEWDSSMG